MGRVMEKVRVRGNGQGDTLQSAVALASIQFLATPIGNYERMKLVARKKQLEAAW